MTTIDSHADISRRTLIILLAAIIFQIFAFTFSKPASALVITLGGDFVAGPAAPPGMAGPLAIGGLRNTGLLMFGAGDHHLRFRVISNNIDGESGFVILTDLRYRSNVAGPLVQTIRIEEEHVHAIPLPPTVDGEHGFSGSATFNLAQAPAMPPNPPSQTARIDKVSTHEMDPLLGLSDSEGSMPGMVPQNPPLMAGPAGPLMPPIALMGPDWDLDTTYTFTLTGGAASMIFPQWVQINLPESGIDRWADEGKDLPPIFIPESATLSLMGLGLAGLGFASRRRR